MRPEKHQVLPQDTIHRHDTEESLSAVDISPQEHGDVIHSANKFSAQNDGSSVVISPDESFRITVEKRRTRLGSHEIIDAVAEGINRKVNLDDPDWVVLVETTGRMTGVSVVRPANILNVQKERVHLAAQAKKRTTFDNKPA